MAKTLAPCAGSLYWKPNDRIDVSISGDYMDQNDEIPAEYIFTTNYAETTTLPNFVTAADQFSIPGAPFRWDRRFETGDPYKTYDNYCDPLPSGNAHHGQHLLQRLGLQGRQVLRATPCRCKNRGVQGKVVFSLTDSIDLTAIAGQREMDLSFGAASDGTVLNDSIIYHEFHEHHWNSELRLTGRHRLLDWSSGLFYYKGIGRASRPAAGRARRHAAFPDGPLRSRRRGRRTATSSYHPIERLNLTGGLRYSDDQKGVDFNSLTDATPPGQTTFVASTASTIFDITLKSCAHRLEGRRGLQAHRQPDGVCVGGLGLSSAGLQRAPEPAGTGRADARRIADQL